MSLKFYVLPSSCRLSLGSVRAQNIGVPSIQDCHRRAAKELTASSAELNLYHVSCKSPPQLACTRLLLRAQEVALRSLDSSFARPIINLLEKKEGLRCCRGSGGQKSSRACCSLPVRQHPLYSSWCKNVAYIQAQIYGAEECCRR